MKQRHSRSDRRDWGVRRLQAQPQDSSPANINRRKRRTLPLSGTSSRLFEMRTENRLAIRSPWRTRSHAVPYP